MKMKISAICLSLTAFLSLVVVLSGCNKSNNSGLNAHSSTITTVLKSSINATVFYQATIRTGLDTVFDGPGPYTVFVPTDSAFLAAGISTSSLSSVSTATVKDMLLYHTLAGTTLITTSFPMTSNSKLITANGDSIFVTNSSKGFFVNGIPVEQSDILLSNGVVHAITLAPLLAAKGTLMQLIQSDTSFSYLSAAVTRASQGSTDIQTKLTSGGPYTLLAPNNNGFRSYGYATVNDVTNANADSLAKILLYHIIPSRLFTCDINLGQSAKTAQGGSLVFTATGSQRQIRGTSNDSNADLLKADVMARNGVLYIINQVLLP
jgi:uncharacterized surface protein with fasciclin (FAS1) repeats